MQTCFQHPVGLPWHVECFGGWTCGVCLTDWVQGGWVGGDAEAVPPICRRESLFFLSKEQDQVSPARRGMCGEGGGVWGGLGIAGGKCVICRYGCCFGGWLFGCCVILEVFFWGGEYNDPFRLYFVSQSSSLAPRKCSEDSCAARLASPCLLIGLACLRGAWVLIVSNRTWHAVS